MDQAWPTEKSTTYHLGGTRYWELEPQEVTKTTDIFSTTAETATKTVDLSITETTCLYIVLKNKENHARTKREAHEGSVRFSTTSAGNEIIFGPRYNHLQNVTSERALRNEKPRRKRRAERRNTPKADEFANTRGDFTALIKGRKLYGIDVKKKKLKHRTAKQQETKRNDKTAKLQAKSHKSRDIISRVREAGSCVVNKKNPDLHKAMSAKAVADHHPRVKSSNDGKSVRRDVTVAERKDKSARKTRGCADCICDIVDVINHVKSILDRSRYPLEEIKALNCSRYKETNGKIVISMDSDVEEDTRVFPQPRYNTESLKGQKYIKSGDLESDSKGDLLLENGTL